MAKYNKGGIHPTRIFKKPEELLKVWNQYKEYLKEQAKNWPKVQYVGRDGKRVEDFSVMPLTIDGFCSWYFEKFGKHIHQYLENKDGVYDDFVGISTHIRMDRNSNLLIGGLLGVYNSNLTGRITGVVDKQEMKVTQEQPLFGEDE